MTARLLLLAYQALFPVIGLGILVRIALAGRGAALREGTGQLRQRLGLLTPQEVAELGSGPEAGRPRAVLWLHAASRGEVAAAAPLVEALARRQPRPVVLLTTSTVAGLALARTLAGVSLACLAPLDFYPCAAFFLERARPRALILFETELWPMLLTLARRRGVRLSLANGRMTERAYRRYRWLAPLWRGLLGSFERAALQTEADARRFLALGLPEAGLRITGNTKFDLPGPGPGAVAEARGRLDALGWSGCPVWIAGSTRPGEEAAVLDAHRAAAERVPGLKLVLAPRHVERAAEAEALVRSRGLAPALWTSPDRHGATPDVLVVDALGALARLYPCGKAVFVGGTLVPIGGHNLLEPAVAGVPVFFGRHTASQAEAAAALLATGGGVVVADGGALATALLAVLTDPVERSRRAEAARLAAERLGGATARTLEHLAAVLSA